MFLAIAEQKLAKRAYKYVDSTCYTIENSAQC